MFHQSLNHRLKIEIDNHCEALCLFYEIYVNILYAFFYSTLALKLLKFKTLLNI